MTAAKRIPRTEFGRNLRAELDARRVSVRELARRMQPDNPEGMRRNIARWLSPEETAVEPSAASVRATAAALGVAPEALAADEDEEEAALYAPLSRAVRDLVRAELRRSGIKAAA